MVVAQRYGARWLLLLGVTLMLGSAESLPLGGPLEPSAQIEPGPVAAGTDGPQPTIPVSLPLELSYTEPRTSRLLLPPEMAARIDPVLLDPWTLAAAGGFRMDGRTSIHIDAARHVIGQILAEGLVTDAAVGRAGVTGFLHLDDLPALLREGDVRAVVSRHAANPAAADAPDQGDEAAGGEGDPVLRVRLGPGGALWKIYNQGSGQFTAGCFQTACDHQVARGTYTIFALYLDFPASGPDDYRILAVEDINVQGDVWVNRTRDDAPHRLEMHAQLDDGGWGKQSETGRCSHPRPASLCTQSATLTLGRGGTIVSTLNAGADPVVFRAGELSARWWLAQSWNALQGTDVYVANEFYGGVTGARTTSVANDDWVRYGLRYEIPAPWTTGWRAMDCQPVGYSGILRGGLGGHIQDVAPGMREEVHMRGAQAGLPNCGSVSQEVRAGAMNAQGQCVDANGCPSVAQSLLQIPFGSVVQQHHAAGQGLYDDANARPDGDIVVVEGSLTFDAQIEHQDGVWKLRRKAASKPFVAGSGGWSPLTPAATYTTSVDGEVLHTGTWSGGSNLFTEFPSADSGDRTLRFDMVRAPLRGASCSASHEVTFKDGADGRAPDLLWARAFQDGRYGTRFADGDGVTFGFRLAGGPFDRVGLEVTRGGATIASWPELTAQDAKYMVALPGLATGPYDVAIEAVRGDITMRAEQTPAFVVDSLCRVTEPVAIVAVNPGAVSIGAEVEWNGSASYDPQGRAITHTWRTERGTEVQAATFTERIVWSGDQCADYEVRNVDGAADQARACVTVDGGPVAVARMSPADANPGEDVLLDGSASSSTEGDIATFEWWVDDALVATGETATTTFAADDSPCVRLVVVDVMGFHDEDSACVRFNGQPIAVASASPQNVRPGESAVFSAEGSSDPDGQIASYLWMVDGAAVATTSTFEHAWAVRGTHCAVLRVTDDDGGVASDEACVEVDSRPEAVAAVNVPFVILGDAVTFDGTGSVDWEGGGLSYQWWDDDVFVSSAATVSRTLASPGEHCLRLLVEDVAGQLDEDEVCALALQTPALSISMTKAVYAVSQDPVVTGAVLIAGVFPVPGTTVDLTVTYRSGDAFVDSLVAALGCDRWATAAVTDANGRLRVTVPKTLGEDCAAGLGVLGVPTATSGRYEVRAEAERYGHPMRATTSYRVTGV